MTRHPGRLAVPLVALALVATLGGYARPPVAQAATPPFTDIAGTTFEADIEWLFAEGITNGCAATLYCPNDPVTRGQMASFLARMFDLPATSTDFFTDDDGTTHEADINRLAEADITTGCTATTFCPKASVRRDEMASFLARAIPLTTGAGDNYFRDDDATTHEANIDRTAAAGITTGCGTWRYCIAAPVTRGQMSGFLHRVVKPIPPPPHPAPGPLHVATGGTDISTCRDKASPCRTISYAVTQAVDDDTILVGPGTFREFEIIVDVSIQIRGDEHALTTIDGTGLNLDRRSLMTVQSGQNVGLSDLRLTGGRANNGGAIRNEGSLTIAHSTLDHNSALYGGGAISSTGPLTIIDTTLNDNSAATGGAIAIGRTTLTLVNSTLTGNAAIGKTIWGTGGAVEGKISYTTLNVVNTTIAGNTAVDRGGAVDVATVRLRNALIVGNVGSSTAEVIGQTTTIASIIGIPAGLTLADILDPAGLKDNGGPTQTIALTDSAMNPAIDEGNAATCAAAPVSGLDQRGQARTLPCDIGAYEVQP